MKLKIAIYSGSIPSTSFIENLIEGISGNHKIYLFGKKRTSYISKNKEIKVYPIYNSIMLNLTLTFIRSFLLLISYPKRFFLLFNEIKKYSFIKAKLNWWIRYVPVLLNLPDIFHIQWAKDLEYWVFLKEKLDCKLVLSLRGAHINYSPIADKKLAIMYLNHFPKVDAFHAVSAAINLEAQKYGAESTKISTIHSLISQKALNLFQFPVKKKSVVLKIISVGRYHWKKGYTVALDACKLLKEQQISFSYTIIAAGTIPEELLFQLHQLNLQDEVIFMDALPQNEVFRKIHESDVLLLPSLEEGIANVVLEAMALGVPVISTKCGGMSEVIISKKTGWLVPVLDPESIAVALKDVLGSSLEKRQEITKNAHNFIKKYFDADRSIEQFNQLYRDVMRS